MLEGIYWKKKKMKTRHLSESHAKGKLWKKWNYFSFCHDAIF